MRPPALLLLALLALLSSNGARATHDKGVVYLGDDTFDKVLGLGPINALVSVDREYAWGSKHDAFKKAADAIASAGASASKLLAVGVPVSVGKPGLGETNTRLAKRFGVAPEKEGEEVDKDTLPRFFFVPAGKSAEDAVPYSGDREDADALARWAADLAGVFVGLKGQVGAMDEAGRRLLAALSSSAAASGKDEKVDALLEAVKTAANEQPAELKEYVEYYVKVLERAAREGGGKKAGAWVSGEEARLRRMAADAAVAENKKETLKWRANVLSGLMAGGDNKGAAGKKDKSEL